MGQNNLVIHLQRMQRAAADACSFTDAMNKAQFRADKRIQQAVVISLINIGEAAAKVMDSGRPGVASESSIYNLEIPSRTRMSNDLTARYVTNS